MQKERIQYIDAVRGFTMILVVFAHVETFMLSIDPGTTFISSLFLSFRMPLFFFISGYLVFKEGKHWTFKVWKHSVWDKIRVQIIPTAFFGLLYTYLFSLGNCIDFISNYHKFGYWFTICLLGMLIIIYTINWLSCLGQKSSPSKIMVTMILITVAIMLFLFKFIYDKNPEIAIVTNYFCFHQICVYFPFFAFGYIASQYKVMFAELLDNELIQACVYLSFGIVFYLKTTLNEADYGVSMMLLLYRSVQDVILGVLGICIVYNFFRKNSSWFSNETMLGKQLQRIGSRTLDVYMLHYFFLTKISFLHNWVSRGNIICELFCVGIISVIITYCTLFVSDILRTSRFVSVYLFGSSRK